MPRWSELKGLLSFRGPAFGREAKLARAATIWDLREMGRRRTPRSVFDYVDGAAEAETTMNRSREDFASIEFRPSVLRDVSAVDPSTTVLGTASPYPFGLAPTGFTRMMHHEGEVGVARAAGRHGLIYSLSTLGTTSTTTLGKAAPDTTKWFQLYLPKDRGLASELLAGARDAGFTAVALTVDTAVPGIRLRDVRNGLTFPPALTFRTLAGMATHPRWWFNVLTTEPLEFVTFAGQARSMPELLNSLWDPTLSTADLEWVRSEWDLPLIIKGIQRSDDAGLVFDLGADAVIVSNHGGRQLDRSTTTLRLLPEIVEAHGSRGEICMDGGVTSGADIVAAIALGASFVMVGRAYLYGLMAGGEAGVDRALTILETEVKRTMQLLGAATIKDLHQGMVSLRN